MQFRCPNCQQPIQIFDKSPAFADDQTVDTITCPSCNSQFSLSSDDESTTISAPGMTVGHFEIRELLGEGAFGTVFKAWDTKLLRNVALKVPRKGRVGSDTAKLFLREARAAAGITHPNVVGVYEVGQHEGGFYIATELIDGISLSEYLKNHAFDPEASAGLILKVLSGIQVFHAKGLIHRDLKPGNILLDVNNEPHISDFGLAKGEDQADVTVTDSGRIVGTLLYMPPEQARGEVRSLTARSDIYAVGVILYELLTGRRPFSSSSSRTLLYSILTDQPASPRTIRREIPRDLETICLKAMEKDPSRRYATAVEMADDLQRFLEKRPILARPVSFPEKMWRLACRHRLVSTLLALMIPLVAAVAVLLLRSSGEEASRLRHRVRLAYSLAGNHVPPNSFADWSILPLDSRTREPRAGDIIRVTKSANVDLQLEPGEYLVVVIVEGFGFHEVYRYVPLEPNVPTLPTYPHESWAIADDGALELPEITIRSEADVVQGMVEVPGGRFQMGDDSDASPRHLREVDSFFVDSSEVTASEFSRFLSLPENYQFPQDAPVVMVQWNAAAAYAEFAGKRLLKEHEFEYLARDLGRSEFPGGNQPVSMPGETWAYDIHGPQSPDRLSTLPVFGIHSNVAEWTDSLLNLYPGVRDPGPDIEKRWNSYRGRVVRGGPAKIGDNDRSLNTWDKSVSYRMARNVDTFDSEIGFRCGKSVKPRY